MKPIRLRPTFPVDAVAIGRRKQQVILNAPRLWFPWLSAQVARFFRPEGPADSPGGNGFLDWSMRNWQRYDDELTARIVKELVLASNQQQDHQLQELIRRLRKRGCYQYAISVGKVLLLKQHIEQQLHADGELTDRKQSLEQLVDSLCDGICQQIYHMAYVDSRLAEALTSRDPLQLNRISSLRDAGYRQVMEAYGCLYDTSQNLPILLKPGERPVQDQDQTSRESLDRLIQMLRDEYDVSRKVHERILTELPDTKALD